MTVIQLVQKDQGLVKAFQRYQKRYLAVGRKPDMTKFLPDLLYSDMRLEGEKITKKEVYALFK
ncbi:MAG: hypothetical protein Q7R82_00710 [Candidatus Daviesbacteria bacterium]|nr:hypothetical protein [Candidatus Daviesbacteria bacterium]